MTSVSRAPAPWVPGRQPGWQLPGGGSAGRGGLPGLSVLRPFLPGRVCWHSCGCWNLCSHTAGPHVFPGLLSHRTLVPKATESTSLASRRRVLWNHVRPVCGEAQARPQGRLWRLLSWLRPGRRSRLVFGWWPQAAALHTGPRPPAWGRGHQACLAGRRGCRLAVPEGSSPHVFLLDPVLRPLTTSASASGLQQPRGVDSASSSTQGPRAPSCCRSHVEPGDRITARGRA